MQSKPRRPTGVTVLAVLEILGGIAGLAAGALILVAAAVIGSSTFQSQYPGLASYATGTLTTLFYAIGGLVVILSILALAVGAGFLGGKGWAWTLAIIAGVINIVTTIAQIAIGFGYSGILGLIIPIIVIYYLTRPHVKAFFGKGPAMAGGSMPSMPMGSMGSMPMGAGSMGTGPTMGQSARFCKNCGASIPAGATRCPNCGASV